MESAADEGAMKDAGVKPGTFSVNVNSANKYTRGLPLTVTQVLLWVIPSNTITFYHNLIDQICERTNSDSKLPLSLTQAASDGCNSLQAQMNTRCLQQ